MELRSIILLPLLLGMRVAAQETYEVTLLDTRTQYADYAPTPTDSGFVMCSIRESAGGAIGFTDATTNRPLSDLYWVAMKAGATQAPVLFSPAITTPVNEGPSAFHPDGRTFCFTRNQVLPKRLSNLRKGNDALGLYFTQKEHGRDWSEPVPFIHNSPAYSLVHPTFSRDGRTLYFASDMPGGLGGMDLYASHHTESGWSAPVNLGPAVNSPAHEVFPSIADNGDLFLASDREGGMGGLDIHVCHGLDMNWSVPARLPEPVNSAGNDMGFARSGALAYFSSDRTGKDRIYSARATIVKFTDCTTQRMDNYCYAVKTRPHAATQELPVDHVWDMGDGHRYTGHEANHCYAGPGRYTVRSLLVDRRSGVTFFELRSTVVEPTRLEQAFIALPDTIRTGRTVALDASLSHIPFAAAELHWDLGDGQLVQGATIRHRFSNAGTYTVRLDMLAAPDGTGRIAHQCNSKQVVVVDRYREQEENHMVTAYQDAMGMVHFRTYQELPFDELHLAMDENKDARFAIELFHSKERISLDDPRFREVRKLYQVIEHFDPVRGVYSYSVGGTNDLKELYGMFRKLRDLQFLDAEVFQLTDEKLIDISVLNFASLDELDHAKLRTNAIHFASGSAELGDTTLHVLQQVTALMAQHRDLHLVIEAHTDDVGTHAFNLELSQLRAQSVVRYLTMHGVAQERLMAMGHGKNQPIASNRTEAGRSQNRRVEFSMNVRTEDQFVREGR